MLAWAAEALMLAWAAAVLAAGTAAETGFDSPPPSLVAWKASRLVVQEEAALPAVHAIAELITQERFGEALARIEGMNRPDVAALQAELAMAVAGHPSFSSPDAVLESTAERLDKALAEAPADLRLLLLHHQLETYRLAANLNRSALGRIRRAQDSAARGQVKAALGELTSFSDDARQAALEHWALCASVEGLDQSETLRQETAQSLRGVLRANPKDPTLGRLSALFERSSEHPWASIAIRSDCLMYPQWQMQRVRALYWCMADAGVYRPNVRQALGEALEELKRLFPGHDLVRSYAGDKMPWGDELGLRPAPPGAPGWAVAMRELHARANHVVEWWFQRRQQPDGAFSDEWEKDCSVLRNWLVPAVCCGNPTVEAGAARLVNGAWSGLLNEDTRGRPTKQDERRGRVQLESAVMPLLFYGDPLYVERLLSHARMIREDYTAVNAQGHLHFNRLPPGLIEESQEGTPLEGMDFLLGGEAMRPAAMLAWYSSVPHCVALLHDWTLAWSEDGARLGVHKPGGVLPARVRFSDGDVDGPDGRWWDPGLGKPFEWDAERQMHVFGKSLAAWSLTGDARVLGGIRGELDLVKRYLGVEGTGGLSTSRAALGESRGPGSAHWAARHIAESTAAILGPYRAATGDRRYDDLEWALLPSYARFLISGDPRDVQASLAADLAAMQTDLALLTSEAPSPDCIDIAAESLLGPLTGSPASLSNPPSWAVTWRHVGVDFTALVRSCDSRSLSAWVYSFADAEIHPQARFWRLEPGLYELHLGKDVDADGVMEGPACECVPFSYAERSDGALFTLAPGVLHLLEIVMVGRSAKQTGLAPVVGPLLQPDIAIMPRDIVLGESPRVGVPCRASVIVHNIGAADAQEVSVEMTVFPVEAEGPGLTVGKVRYGTLPHPGDLEPKRGLASFEWRPDAPGRYRIQVSVSCSNPEGEIWSGNNRSVLEVFVAK